MLFFSIFLVLISIMALITMVCMIVSLAFKLRQQTRLDEERHIAHKIALLRAAGITPIKQEEKDHEDR